MSYQYTETNLTNLGQLKKLAQRTQSEISSVASRVSTIENAGYIPESTIDSKISAAVAGALIPGGSVTFANLPALSATNKNHIYNVEDAFTSTADFKEGAGVEYPAGTNVAIIDVGTEQNPVFKYDAYTGTFDFSGFATKQTSAVTGNFATFDASGNVHDSGTKPADFLTAHQDITGKADKVTGATSGNFASLDENGNLTDSGSKAADFAAAGHTHSDKADKVQSATDGDLAGLDSNGNLTDSGVAASSVMQKVASATANDFAKLNASGEVVDAGYGLASDQNVEDMIHDVWGDPEQAGE